MMQHRNRGGAEVSMHHPMKHLCLEEAGMWCLTGLENGKQVVKRWPQVS